MIRDEIIEISIDELGRPIIKPRTQKFDYVNRAAMGVHRDKNKQCLYSPKPRAWTYFDWYKHIIKAVESEYGCRLVPSDKTKWINISDSIKQEIEAWGNAGLA